MFSSNFIMQINENITENAKIGFPSYQSYKS